MKTDDLIRVLAEDPVRPMGPRTVLVLGLVPSLAIIAFAVWLVLGFRPDLAISMTTPVSVARILLAGTLGLVATRLALTLARPEGSGKVRLWPLAVVAAAALGLLLWAYVTTPAEARQMAMFGKTFVFCLVVIPLLSILPVSSMFAVLRRGATIAPARAGFVAGLAGSGFATAVYALYCTQDNPLFYVTWFGLAILGVSLFSAMIAPRVLHW
ncbi:DUF1109 domain-containing protein [Tabrizicola sp.]|jgi:hypothetical protein|uniref:DUF1109 domain-containing protein n=1 Tax=Tabrizicola sp. TaxID=2005166 RepID=UPI0025E925E1|nr:DUF1109 domain-containing protein [Tabrizicola sp.]MBY0349919.1 DUF1109 domain-containing protein [Tabrizicola sp.]